MQTYGDGCRLQQSKSTRNQIPDAISSPFRLRMCHFHNCYFPYIFPLCVLLRNHYLRLGLTGHCKKFSRADRKTDMPMCKRITPLLEYKVSRLSDCLRIFAFFFLNSQLIKICKHLTMKYMRIVPSEEILRSSFLLSEHCAKVTTREGEVFEVKTGYYDKFLKNRSSC